VRGFRFPRIDRSRAPSPNPRGRTYAARFEARARLRAMAELLSADEVASGLADVNDWSGDTSGITRTISLPTFPAAIDVVDRVAMVAEELDHHPDIDIRWRKLTFECSTHSAGGVTAKDFALASRIDEIVAAVAAG